MARLVGLYGAEQPQPIATRINFSTNRYKAAPRTHSSSGLLMSDRRGGACCRPRPYKPSLEVFLLGGVRCCYLTATLQSCGPPAHHPPTAHQLPAPTATQHHYHRSPAAASVPGPEPEPGQVPGLAEAAGQPSAAEAAEAAHTEPWPQPLQPWRLSCRPYTRPRRWHHRPWPPWPWHRPQPPARPGPEPVRRPAWPPPASPLASSTSSSFLLPLSY